MSRTLFFYNLINRQKNFKNENCFSGKQHLFRPKTEVLILSNGIAIGVSATFPASETVFQFFAWKKIGTELQLTKRKTMKKNYSKEK